MFALLAATLAAAVDAQNPLRVDEARTVQLDTAAKLFRDGKPLSARDGVLLRMTVNDASPFTSKDSGRILLGHGVCETLGAAAGSQAIVVFCPKAAAGEPQQVWQIDSLPDPARLPADRTQRMLDRATSVALGQPADGGKFKDLEALRKSVQK